MVHVLAISVSAALLAYLLHHLPPFADHAAFNAVAAIALAAGLTAWVAGRQGLRPTRVAPLLVLSPESEVQVADAGGGDLDFCAELHAGALPHGFFVDLGPRFLRAYHRTFAESPHALLLVARLDGHPIGFVAGALDPAMHRRWLFRRRGLELASIGAMALIARPRVGLRFLRTRIQRYLGAWRSNRSGPLPDTRPEAPVPHLFHVATVDGARGFGGGRALVDAFVAAADASGARSVTLTTLEGPDGAGDFYERLGWIRTAGGLVFDGRAYEQWSFTCAASR